MINRLSFDSFIRENNRYKQLENIDGAKKVYDFLLKEENIDAMIGANNNGKPALYGVQMPLETNFNQLNDFDLQDNFVKQSVGAMVKHILEPFGYVAARQRDLPKAESKYFVSAKHYDYDLTKAEYELVKRIEVRKRL